MICVLALIVFGIMGIFSATHRKLAVEALDCVFRRVTFRKCDSRLDQRLKSQITGKLMRMSTRLARIVFKHFELLSWVFLILFLSSMIYSAVVVYNYALYGNCYGPESDAFCPLTIFEGEALSEYETGYTGHIIYPNVDDDPSIGPEYAKVTIIEFGCLMCPYTRKAEPVVKELLETYKNEIRFVYRDFPLSQIHADSDWHSEAANCANEQGKYWEYRDRLFQVQEHCKAAQDHKFELKQVAEELGLDMEKFNECMDLRKYKEEVINDFWDGVKAGVKGTPKFFINNRTITGPKPVNAFKKIIEEELEK